jgi:hypothetical protein
VDINSASRAISENAEGVGSVSDASKLSAQERIFCDVFVGNGGKAGEAARAAGYADASADVTACKLLCRSRVADRIKNLCGRFGHAALPVAIQTLVTCAGAEKALWKDRIKAANSLIELAGLFAPKGGIQVNVGIVNGSQAQQIISEVHARRTARLSDIPTAMPDTFAEDMRTLEAVALPPPADPPGGDQLQGPAAGTRPLPVPSTANSVVSTISCECPLCRDVDAPAAEGGEEDGFDAFKAAFDED